MMIENALNIEAALGCKIKDLTQKIDSSPNFLKLKVLENWENEDDITIFETININTYLKGEIYIINDASFIHNVIFETRDNEISDFITLFPTDKYRGGIFNGDVYFISLSSMNLVYFHHNGIWFLYKLPLI